MSEEDIEYIEEEIIDEQEPEPEGEEDVTEEGIADDSEASKAKKYGHLSKEDWIAQGRDPSKYKTPAEFNKTGEEIESRYTALKNKVDQRDREIQALVDYQQRTAQREYERAKQEMEQRLAASKDDMDVEGVAHYTKELVRLQDNEEHSNAQKMNQSQQAAKNAFIERNQHWFNDRNPDLQSRAIEIDNEIQADINKGIIKVNSYEDISLMIEKRLSYEHPERVIGQRHSVRPIAGQSSVNKTAVVKKDSFKNLSQEHKDTFNVYKRINPNTTEAEFIQRLKADGEL